MFKKLCPARVVFLLSLGLALQAPAQIAPPADLPAAPPLQEDPPEPRGIPNDVCFNPQILNGPVVTINFNTALATTGIQGQDNPNCAFSGTTQIANDVWFNWTSPATGIATLRSCGATMVDTKAAVYEGPGCPQAGAIACDDDDCGVQTILMFNAIAGATYTLQIGKFPGAADGTGTFWLIGPGNGPPNDLCSNAMPVGFGSFQFGNFLANSDGPQACGQIGADLWYRFVAPSPTLVRVSTCDASNLDTVIAAYSGNCANPQLLACNDDTCALQSQIEFNALPGQQYLIRLGGFQGAFGSGVITIAPGPPCILQCPPVSTPEGEPCGFDTNGGCNSTPPRFLALECNAVVCGSIWAQAGTRDTDWYRFEVPSPDPITVNISLVAELPAIVFLVRFNGPCPDFTIIATANTPPCGPPAMISQDVDPGQFGVIVAPADFDGFPCGSRNAYTLSVDFEHPCPTQAPFFAGMRHTALGVAQLSLGSIIITNTGGAGTNGAVVTVGPTAEGWRGDGRVIAGPLDPGAALVAAATGTVAGIPNNTLGLARIDATAAQVRLIPDFSPISATTYTLQAFAGGAQVFSQTGRTGVAFTRANNGAINSMTFSCIPAPCLLPPCPRTGPFVPVFECRFPIVTQFQIDGALVLADSFLITPEGADAPVTSISEVEITAALADPLIFDAEALVFRRFFHIAQGDARFNAANNQLGLFNMDAINADGVRVELEPDCAHYVAELASLGDPGDPANPIPDGAFIEYRTRGILNGATDALISTSRYTDVGARLDARLDFAPTGTDNLRLNFFDEQGQPLGSEVVPADLVVLEVTGGWVRTLEKSYDSCGQQVDQRPCWVPAAGMVTPGGQSFQAVFLEVFADPTVPFAGYTASEMEFSRIPAVQIVDERAEAVTGVCCACDFNDNQFLDSQDFFDFLACFFGGGCPPKQDPDFNDDTFVNSQDFFDFLGCFFAPPKGCH